MTVRKTFSIVSPSAQKCIDNFPPPLLLSVDSWLGRLGVRFHRIWSSSIQRLCPILLVVCYHKYNTNFFSDPGPRNDHRPGGFFSANTEARSALALHSCSLSSDPHKMWLNRFWSSGSSPAHPSGFRGAPRGDHLSTRSRLLRGGTVNGPIRFPQTPFQCPRSRTATLGSGGRSTFPALTMAWLYIEPSPCGGVRPAGDPVDSDPGAVFKDDPHPRSDAGRPPEPWVCHHTREPTVLSRVSTPAMFTWILTVFTSLACYPVEPSPLSPKHGWLGQG